MRISEVIRRKGDDVVTIRPEATVTDLLALLAERNIGAVVVSSDDGHTVAGIVSERDVVRHLNNYGSRVLANRVETLMTTEVLTCSVDDDLRTLAMRMTDARIRHLPVVEDGQLRAIVSIGDIVKNRIDELQAENEHLTDYVHG